MPIPVPIPSGTLPITDADTARAESFVAALAQILKYGTSGATLNTPNSTIPDGNSPTALKAVEIASAKEQLFFRQQALAITKSLIAFASSSVVGITRLSTDPVVPSVPTALNSEEVTTVPSPNKVPRARVDGTLDPGWITGTPGPGPSVIQTFTGVCAAGDAVGDLMYVSGGSYAVSKVDITDYSKMPSVGCIVSKPSATSCVIQTAGLVSGVYAGLTPGKIYFAGTNSRPNVVAPVPGVSQLLFHQAVGIALDTNILLIVANPNLTRVRGTNV